jgi:hypothetical protein
MLQVATCQKLRGFILACRAAFEIIPVSTHPTRMTCPLTSQKPQEWTNFLNKVIVEQQLDVLVSVRQRPETFPFPGRNQVRMLRVPWLGTW